MSQPTFHMRAEVLTLLGIEDQPNQIWFSILVRKLLRRGNFASKSALRAKIEQFIVPSDPAVQPTIWETVASLSNPVRDAPVAAYSNASAATFTQPPPPCSHNAKTS